MSYLRHQLSTRSDCFHHPGSSSISHSLFLLREESSPAPFCFVCIRFQPIYGFEHFAGPTASASINVYQAVLPNTQSVKSHEPFFQPSALQNNFGSYDSKNKYSESTAKDIRWEFGFKPPLVPSVAIDEFGNPLNEKR